MIGVGVEGPSDQAFWRNLLSREFPHARFDVWSMKSRPKLIGRAADLLDTFRSLRYSAGLLILDIDKEPCVAEVFALFDDAVRVELRKPLSERYLFLCVARRKAESWFLADQHAVLTVLPAADYEMPADTAVLGIGTLERLWKQQYGGNAALNKIRLAQLIAPHFSPGRARDHSASFDCAWTRIRTAAARTAP